MNILKSILENTRNEIANVQRKVTVEQLKEMPGFFRKCISLKEALNASSPSIIAEIKKASPSKGIICEDFNHRFIAKTYSEAGARALSVLTDKRFFQGDIKFIEDIRSDISIPILRKDFIIDSYQLVEAKAYGADAVLLIAAALEKDQLGGLYIEAEESGLECLVEVHNETELETFDLSGVKIIGINNRNLEDFSVDIETSIRLAKMIPSGTTIVSESGISSRANIDLLMQNGIHGFLIGESLMRDANPGDALRALLASEKER